MENEKLPVKPAIKNLYEEIFSTRFIVSADQLRQNSESPIWDCLKLPAELIVKNLNDIKDNNFNVGKVTLQITATAILEVKEQQDD